MEYVIPQHSNDLTANLIFIVALNSISIAKSIYRVSIFTGVY